MVLDRFRIALFYCKPQKVQRGKGYHMFATTYFSFSVNLSSFALVSKVRLILHYSHLRTIVFQENKIAIDVILSLSVQKIT